MVWVSPAYGDTQTQGVVMGGHLSIVRGGLGISGVQRYSDTGVGDGWTSKDLSGYLQRTGILRHKGWWWVDI